MIFGSVWGSAIHIAGMDEGNTQEASDEYLMSMYHSSGLINYSAYAICENCKTILDTLIAKNDKNLCPECRCENIFFMSAKMSDNYKDKINTKVSDAEFLTLLLQKYELLYKV